MRQVNFEFFLTHAFIETVLFFLAAYFPQMAQDILNRILSRGPFALLRGFIVLARHSKFALNCLAHHSCSSLRLCPLLHLMWIFPIASFWLRLGVIFGSFSEDNCMHAVNWPFLLTTWEEFFALDCTCDDITHYRILLRQISCKIHFLPRGQKD